MTNDNITLHETYMRRCLELARLGAGNVAPNPMVGAVIVHNGKIIGEGYHQKYGFAHAEVNAVNSVKNKELLKESEIYVSLEPCAHYGKTPPCADLIVKCGFKHVYVGCRDSFEKVDGKGIEKIRNAGIPVTVGILEQECINLNRRFFTWCNQKRPYVILKWAQTSDGFIDIIRTANTPQGSVRISNPLTQHLSHRWRTEEAAIMVGYNTAINDNPSLTARFWQGRNPLRVVIDRNNSLPKSLKIFDNASPTLVISDTDPAQILHTLYNRQIQSVIIEGGAHLHQAFINANLWDEARIFTSPVRFNEGLKAAKLKGKLIESQHLNDNILEIYTPSMA